VTRRVRALAVLALIALTGAGCGNSSSGSDEASGQDQAVRFAQCMRDNGIAAFPDPDASGQLTLDGVVNGSSIDPDGPAWTRAIGACRDLRPSGFTGHTRSPQEQDAALVFARCIRDNGVKDFPDPARGDPLVDTNRIPSAATGQGKSILNAAMQTCRGKAEAAMADR
jgi:hypothetical protein